MVSPCSGLKNASSSTLFAWVMVPSYPHQDHLSYSMLYPSKPGHVATASKQQTDLMCNPLYVSGTLLLWSALGLPQRPQTPELPKSQRAQEAG